MGTLPIDSAGLEARRSSPAREGRILQARLQPTRTAVFFLPPVPTASHSDIRQIKHSPLHALRPPSLVSPNPEQPSKASLPPPPKAPTLNKSAAQTPPHRAPDPESKEHPDVKKEAVLKTEGRQPEEFVRLHSGPAIGILPDREEQTE